MHAKVLSYIEDNNLIKPKDKVLVALSGGPDSVCLLNMLFELKEKLNIEIAAAHLNHLLRGEDAYKDEQYVMDICTNMGIKYFIKRVDINAYSKKYKISSEMAGRNVRYSFFEEILVKEKFNKIATAHNANDQAETILFRLMRGTGLEGLGGIKVSRDNKIIRPILCLSREEVENYIKINDLNPRIDKTNFEKIYNRNKIRLDILPYMRENFNEDIVQTLNRMSVLLQKDNEFLENLSLSLYNKSCAEYDDYFIIKKEIFKREESIVNRIIRRALTRYSKSNYDFEMKHIYEIANLAKKYSGKLIHLPNEVYVENVYGDIYIKGKIGKSKGNNKNNEIILNKDHIYKNAVEFYRYDIEFSLINNCNTHEIEFDKNNLVKYFDFDKVSTNISVRNRRNGDRIIPLGMSGNKKLKDIFIDMKIPKEERELIPILCFDEKIAWIVGIRTSEEYKITSKSKNILKVVFQRKEY